MAADAYGLLNGVLESLMTTYVHRQPGLQRTDRGGRRALRRVDADLHKHLDEVGVLLLQVTFRWINCLLVRELPMRCAIRLWDTCLAEERGFRTFFPYVCAAFLCRFSDALKAKPTEDVHLFLTSLPTSNWADDEVETLLWHASSRRSSGPRRRTSSTSPTASRLRRVSRKLLYCTARGGESVTKQR